MVPLTENLTSTATPSAFHATRPPNASSLQFAARRSVERALLRTALWVLVSAAAAGAATLALSAAPLGAAAAVMAALAVGSLLGHVLLQRLGGEIAEVALRPLELLLGQPGMVPEPGAANFHWADGRALSRAEIEADFSVLELHLRHTARASREAMRELENARERATQQSNAKTQFLAAMSHELRTPLNAILGYSMLLKEEALEAGSTSFVADLERIQTAGSSLLGTINDILDLVKIEGGNAALENSVIDVRELAQAAADTYPVERRNGNSLEINVTDEVCIMIGDASKVQQCLRNLLSNAFKFTSNGRVSLEIAAVVKEAVPFVTFSVRDTGIGIDAESLEGVFDEFGQDQSGSTRRFGGLGLGLAITRRLARMMGGDCVCESVPGEGSTFCLSLPLNRGCETQAEHASPATAVRTLPVRRSERSTLIIEDDEAAADLMYRWFDRMGYDVFIAGDGEAGLAMAREHRPDLILLDALLPRLSGYEVLTRLQADPTLRLIPVILVTVDDDRVRGLAAGASDYLRKPVSEDQLRVVTGIYRERATGEVLVIDDDDDAAELIKRSLEQAGFSTRRASDGLEGVEMAMEARPAAIVLDLTMPRLDGFGFIERLSTEGKLKDIPLIIVSGRELSLAQHRTLSASPHRFFTKGNTAPREIAQSLREMVA